MWSIAGSIVSGHQFDSGKCVSLRCAVGETEYHSSLRNSCWGFESLMAHQVMEMWSSLVYGNGLENRRGRNTSVSSNLTVSASFRFSSAT